MLLNTRKRNPGWAHKHVFNTRWHLILFLLLLYSRQEKNNALQALSDELLASKKSLESLKQQVSKTEKNSDYYQSSWSSAIYQWKDLVLCVVPHPNSFHIANSTLLLAMENRAYNCMYRNIICNRLEEYTIL